jgi:hypothetical protein
MKIATKKTDQKGRITLPSDFADCLVTVERVGDELRVRKAKGREMGKHSFKQLMAGVTSQNIHSAINTGRVVGREAL